MWDISRVLPGSSPPAGDDKTFPLIPLSCYNFSSSPPLPSSFPSPLPLSSPLIFWCLPPLAVCWTGMHMKDTTSLSQCRQHPVEVCKHTVSARVMQSLHASCSLCTCHAVSARVMQSLHVSCSLCTCHAVSARVMQSLHASCSLCTRHAVSARVMQSLHASCSLCTRHAVSARVMQSLGF